MKLHPSPLLIMIAAIASATTTCVAAAEPDVRIAFANYGGINDWRADGTSAIYIQGRNRKWYRAELLASCTELPFAEHVGFVVEPNGEFDRFSAIIVRGQHCLLKSLQESTAPPVRERGKKLPATPEPATRK